MRPRYDQRMRRTVFIGYLLALHLALLVLVLQADVPQRVAVRLGLADAPTHPHIVAMRAVLAERDEQFPQGAALFLGDSLTEQLAGSAVVDRSENFGVGRQRTDHLLEAMPAAVGRAGSVYLLIGTNDFLQGREAGIDARLTAIAAAIPDVPLVWTGIMLVEARAANDVIRKLCAARRQCRYVEPLTDPALFVDGVHLTPDGYRQWIHRLRG